MTWLIVGFGNDICGDDRFGIVVADAVAQANTPATIITKKILAPELIEDIKSAEGVVFIDASASLAPGQLKCFDLQSDSEHEGYISSAIALSHHCSPKMLIQLNFVLNGTRPPAWLYVVGGADFNFSEEMTPSVQARVQEVKDAIIFRLK
jgi:hydrogenase maturation protease